MLFREMPGAVIAISQPSHAWLSGQIIRSWGNAEFGRVTPYEDVCLGAEQHDIGWHLWEQSPTLNPRTGRPHSFRELSVAAHTAIWDGGTAMALTLGRYPALLVSLHGTGLYASFDAASASLADRVAVREFLTGQQVIQHQLTESLRDDKHLGEFFSDETIERNRRLVRAADRMSIAICSGMRDPAISGSTPREAVVRDVPTATGGTDLRLLAVNDDMDTIVVSPWPFVATTVRFKCEGTLLPSCSFHDDSEMRVALRNARKVVISVDLRPER